MAFLSSRKKKDAEKVIHNAVEFNRSPLCCEKQQQDRLGDSITLDPAAVSAAIAQC